jgi:hypothetical protein
MGKLSSFFSQALADKGEEQKLDLETCFVKNRYFRGNSPIKGNFVDFPARQKIKKLQNQLRDILDRSTPRGRLA